MLFRSVLEIFEESFFNYIMIFRKKTDIFWISKFKKIYEGFFLKKHLSSFLKTIITKVEGEKKLVLVGVPDKMFLSFGIRGFPSTPKIVL